MTIKRSLFSAALAAACLVGVTNSPAAILSVGNGEGDNTDVVFTTSSGNTTQTGFYAIYAFGTEGSSVPPTTAAALKANGTTNQLQRIDRTPGNTQSYGLFFASFDSIANIASAQLYFVVGNGADVVDSTELAMLQVTGRPTLTGSDGPPPGQDLGNYFPDVSDLIIGSSSLSQTYDWSTSGVGGSASANYLTPSVALEAVPEPSGVVITVLLSGLALVNRRRR